MPTRFISRSVGSLVILHFETETFSICRGRGTTPSVSKFLATSQEQQAATEGLAGANAATELVKEGLWIADSESAREVQRGHVYSARARSLLEPANLITVYPERGLVNLNTDVFLAARSQARPASWASTTRRARAPVSRPRRFASMTTS